MGRGYHLFERLLVRVCVQHVFSTAYATYRWNGCWNVRWEDVCLGDDWRSICVFVTCFCFEFNRWRSVSEDVLVRKSTSSQMIVMDRTFCFYVKAGSWLAYNTTGTKRVKFLKLLNYYKLTKTQLRLIPIFISLDKRFLICVSTPTNQTRNRHDELLHKYVCRIRPIESHRFRIGAVIRFYILLDRQIMYIHYPWNYRLLVFLLFLIF